MEHSSVQIEMPDLKIFQEEGYKKARFEAHNALLWMARGAHSFLEPQEDNAHLDLFWLSENHILSTAVFDNDLQIGLNLPELEMFFRQKGEKVKHSFWFDDRTPAFAEAWYLVELLHRDRDRSKFSVDLPFTCANMLLGDTAEHEASAVTKELSAMHNLVLFTTTVFNAVEDSLKVNDAKVDGRFRCSPETFNFRQDLSNSSDGSVISLGLSVGDDLRPTPFYFANKLNRGLGHQRHRLDYDPNTILSFEVISRDGMTHADIVNSLRDKIKDI